MERKSAAGVFFLPMIGILLAINCSVFSRVPTLGPIMQFQDTVLDLGMVEEGTHDYHFHFRNVGDEDLLIQYAKSSCGCVVAEWPNEPVSPQEEGEIRVKFNSVGRRGLNVKTITLESNDRTLPMRRLTIKATVIPISKGPSMDFLPAESLDLGTFVEGEVAFKFRFHNSGDAPLVVDAVRSSTISMAATGPDTAIPPDGWGLIEGTWDANGQTGAQTKYVTVLSNDANVVKRLTIMADVLERSNPPRWPQIEFVRTIIDTGAIAEKSMGKAFVFQNVGKAPLQIQKVESPDAKVFAHWDYKAIPVGGAGYLWLSWDFEGRFGPQAATFVVHTNDSLHSPTTLVLKANVLEKQPMSR